MGDHGRCPISLPFFMPARWRDRESVRCRAREHLALAGLGTPRTDGAGTFCAGKSGNLRLDLLLSSRVHLSASSILRPRLVPGRSAASIKGTLLTSSSSISSILLRFAAVSLSLCDRSCYTYMIFYIN